MVKNGCVVGVTSKNSREELRVEYRLHKQTLYVDLRIYDDYGPTRRGFSIRPEKARDLIKLLERAAALHEAQR